MKAANDKKKTVIVAILGVVMLSVGVFQFMSPGSTTNKKTNTAKTDDKKDPNAEADQNTAPGKGTIIGELAQRDPFIPQIGKDANELPPTPETPNVPVMPGATKGPKTVAKGPQPPVSPLGPGNFEQIPGLGQDPSQLPGNGGANPASGPSMKLSGVVIGNRPMAVITDGNGKQKLVRIGDEVDGRKVIAISKGAVVLAGTDPKADHETLTMGKDAIN